MNYIKNQYVTLALRFIVGGILIYASVEKIINPTEFAKSIGNYHVLPFGLENIMALVLPWLEFLVGAALIFGIFLRGAAVITMGMMAMFIIAIISAILRGYNIECGCGLKTGEMVGIKKIFEDIIYLLFSWQIYNYNKK